MRRRTAGPCATPKAGCARDGLPDSRRPTGPQEASAEHRRVEDALRKRLGTDIRVTARRKGRGLIALSYYSNDDLARLLELLLGRPFEG